MRLAAKLTLFAAIASSIGFMPCAQAQARETVAAIRARYNTAKTNAKATGALKDELDRIDQAILRASRLGQSGELRRLYNRGITISAGRQWTDELDFAGSLALRTEKVFVDPAGPVDFRLEQIYAARMELNQPLAVRVGVYRTGNAPEKLKDAGSYEGVSRDLSDSPLRFSVDFSGVPDGRVNLRADVMASGRTVGTVAQVVEVRKGIDERLRRLRTEITQVKGFEALRAEVLFPADYIRNVDTGRITLGQFDIVRELTTAEDVLTGIKAGRDPLAAKTGDFKRHYLLEEAGEIMPYRIYVPSGYKAERAYPLVIALHGNGGTDDTFFTAFNGELPKLAEERGYIVAAPMGYRVDGGYGYNNGSRPAEDGPKLQFSEKDVMRVLDLMRRDYKIDANRIYLAGHSMGASGTWYLGPKYSQIWAAMAPFAGGATPEGAPQVKHIPQFVVHGDADATAPVERSRVMVAELKRLGVEHQYVEVPGGTHGGVVAPNLRGMMDFFDRHRKAGN